MAKIVTVPEKVKKILQVLVSIFPKDVYICNNMYCLEGVESVDLNVGTNFCILSLSDKNYLEKFFGKDTTLIYISDIRKMKSTIDNLSDKIVDYDNFTYKNLTSMIDNSSDKVIEKSGKVVENEYFKYINSEEEKSNIFKERDKYLKLTLNIPSWKRFEFTDNQLKAMIDENSRITLFSNDKDIPEIYISKSLFPTVIHKELEKLFYQVIKSNSIENGYDLVVNYNKDDFQIYMIFTYLNYKKEEKSK